MFYPEFPNANVVSLADDLWVAEEMRSNMYILKGSEKVLVIDTAYGLTDMPVLARFLCGEDMPVICANSHEHPDHNAGNAQFPEVMVGRFGEPFSHDPLKYDVEKLLLGEEAEKQRAYAETCLRGPAEKIVPFAEGDVIDLGNIRLTVLEIPGHSLGSVALFDEANGRIFTGDTVLRWDVWGQLPKSSAALSVYLSSLEKLQALEDRVQYVYPAHSLPGEDSAERFLLPPEVFRIYADGTREIVEGRIQGEPKPAVPPIYGDGMRVTYFEIGGMVWDPKRI